MRTGLLFAVAALLCACGGGGSSSPPVPACSIQNPPPPVFNPDPPQGATLGEPYTFTIVARGCAVSLSLIGTLPAWLTFTSASTASGASAAISGTPTALGSFAIEVRALDGVGQSVNQNFTVLVFQHGFRLSGTMLNPVGYHLATLLTTGQVLITGGFDASSANDAPTASAELFDPMTQTFMATGSMTSARVFQTATLLCDTSATTCSNPRVLVAGGETGQPAGVVQTAELYDAVTGTFSSTGSLLAPRERHTATLLGNGKVLIAGGSNTSLPAGAELFDPGTATFTATGSLNIPRNYHTATLLKNGKVLIAGGLDSNNAYVGQAELYDPTTGIFTPTGNMISARHLHTATLLTSGKVLIAGGESNSIPPTQMPAEIYDPDTGTFTATGSFVTPQFLPAAAVLLPDGTVLIAGGETGTGDLPAAQYAELFDPTTGTFSETGGLQIGRDPMQMTALGKNNQALVLVTGGGSQAQVTAEVYQ